MQNIQNAFEQFQKLFICFEKILCYLCFFVNLSKKYYFLNGLGNLLLWKKDILNIFFGFRNKYWNMKNIKHRKWLGI